MIFWSYFKKLGGFQTVRQYAKYKVLWGMAKTVLTNPFSRQSYKKAYSEALKKVEPLLTEKYSPLMKERKEHYASPSMNHHRSNIVWFCWLQGIEQAPPVVKVCYDSLKGHLSDRDIRVIDAENWTDYVSLPEYIVQKWQKKQIPNPHFTDLIRLQLLIKYGGTWIDSTVICTGLTPQNEKQTKSFLDADLFLFQYTQPGSDQWGGIGNWFITACTNNNVMLVLRDMLFAYWKEFDCVVDYFIFHLFFSMLRDVYPSEIAAMPYGYAGNSVWLGYHLGSEFKADKWEKLTQNVAFHKLTYSIRSEVLKVTDNYYHHITDGVEYDNPKDNEDS